jgi:hypothetical protein
MTPPRPTAHAIKPAPTPEEAAAIMAAVGRFMRATAVLAPPPREAGSADRWREEALLEGVQREDAHTALRDPWINT